VVSTIEPLNLYIRRWRLFFVKQNFMTLFYGSSYQRALFRLLALCALFLSVSPALHAETGTAVDFRVSGIMRVGDALYRGLVESPDGKKGIVREGDIIDHWKVVRINEHCILLSKENKTHEECLSGTGETVSQEASKEKSPAAPAEKAENQSAAANKASMSHFKQADKVELLQSLDGLALKERDLTMEAISEAVLPLTDLPAGFRITEINAKVPESAQNALDAIRLEVDKSRPIRLTVQNEAGNQNIIYLQTAAQPTGKQ
jgi:hypothetical protein